MTSRISISFSKFADASFLQKALFIITCMTNNIYFTSPVPTLVVVQAAYDKYAAALNAAAALGRQQVLDKNIARKELEDILAQLGRYVMFIANGDEAKLGSSGFTITKYPQPRVLLNPGNVTITIGSNPGELISQVPMQNATGFNHQITDALPTLDTVWSNFITSTSKHTFTGLIPGKQYWVRVIALGTRKQQEYSTVGTQYASL